VRLQLHALAYNLAIFLRCIELPGTMADWSLTSLQLKLIKIGARVVRHARAITFQLAEVAVTGRWSAPSSPPSADCERLAMRMTAITPKLNENGRMGLSAALKNTATRAQQAASRAICPVSAPCAPDDAARTEMIVLRSD
jgi:hypothetical protein